MKKKQIPRPPFDPRKPITWPKRRERRAVAAAKDAALMHLMTMDKPTRDRWLRREIQDDPRLRDDAVAVLDSLHLDFFDDDKPSPQVDSQSATVPPTAPAAKLVDYYPELDDWLAPGWGEPIEQEAAGVFTIHRNAGELKKGRLICTVHTAPDFSADVAKRIAQLMSSAPDLWRTLQKFGPLIAEDDIGGIQDMAEITATLHDAAGRRPYEMREPDSDEQVLRLRMKAELEGNPLTSEGGAA